MLLGRGLCPEVDIAFYQELEKGILEASCGGSGETAANASYPFRHSHGRLPTLGKSLDVGVDGHDFAPWSWEEIKTYMAGRPNNENFLGIRE